MDEIGDMMRSRFSNKLRERVQLSAENSSGAMCIDLITGDVDAVAQVVAKGVFEPPWHVFAY
jgi:hypothetical protein